MDSGTFLVFRWLSRNMCPVNSTKHKVAIVNCTPHPQSSSIESEWQNCYYIDRLMLPTWSWVFRWAIHKCWVKGTLEFLDRSYHQTPHASTADGLLILPFYFSLLIRWVFLSIWCWLISVSVLSDIAAFRNTIWLEPMHVSTSSLPPAWEWESVKETDQVHGGEQNADSH